MYTIKIDYSTGDSFGTHNEKDFIGYAWNSFERAKQAKKVIIEHDRYFAAKGSRVVAKPKPNRLFDRYGEYSVPVEDDNGNAVEIHAFWRGYFEEFCSATVVKSR